MKLINSKKKWKVTKEGYSPAKRKTIFKISNALKGLCFIQRTLTSTKS
ncbi:hypothetical protein AA637_04675 [Cyanobacterium sp. HL-69]|nr:hypothetical protein AA637_04675 [Cyanobacterium sp. HL-69]